MMKNSATLTIYFEKSSYFQGETLKGTIKLSILKSLKPNELILKIKGKEIVSTIKTIIISHEFSIFHYKDSSLPIGQYYYPFSLIIPSKLPASINDKSFRLKIQYKLKSDLRLAEDETDHQNIHDSQVFQIKQWTPISEKPIKKLWSSGVQVFCFFGGTTLFNVRLDKFFFKDGETASIKCYIDNSNCRIPLKGIFFRLIRKIEKRDKNGLIKKFSKTIFTGIHEVLVEANNKDRVFTEIEIPITSGEADMNIHTTATANYFKNSYILKVSGYHNYYCFVSTLSDEEFPIIIYEEKKEENILFANDSNDQSAIKNILRADSVNLMWKEAIFYRGKNLDKFVYPEFDKVGFDMNNNKIFNAHQLPDSTKNDWEIEVADLALS